MHSDDHMCEVHPIETGSLQSGQNFDELDQQGFTLIEVLVALVVLSIGLLGLITLDARSLGASHNAYLASVASIQAMSLEEMIRANAEAADTYADVISHQLVPPDPNNCDASQSEAYNPTELADYDSRCWAYATKKLFPENVSPSLTKPTNTGYMTLTLSWRTPDRGFGADENKRNFIYVFRIGPT